ncbi:MAG: radical SAM protein [Deltaproteobacteria bacterium]|nr:radical SAM protein [Deltaproteobacteria bacterium]
MKIALTRPNYHSHLITPQLGLGYISSYLKERGFRTSIIDGLNLGLTHAEIAQRCSDAGMVGINCLSDYYPKVVELTRALKDRGKIVVIGGPHASVLPRETLIGTGCDYVVVGEGEETMYELASALVRKAPVAGIAGLMSRESSTFTKRPYIKDLDSLPFPDWKEMDPRTYKKAPHGGFVKRFPVAPITSTRGCPYECTFCASPEIWGRRIRYRSPKNVVDEIERLTGEFGVKEIHFEDDNLTLKTSHVEGICELILERKIKVSWATPNGIRVDTITPRLLNLMKRSGCYFIAFGIESGNEPILKKIKKETDLATITHAVHEARNAGLLTQGFFIFGLPGETERTIQNSLDYAKSIPLDKAQFLLLDLLPGSKLWQEHKAELGNGTKGRSYQEVTWVPSTIKREALEKAPSKAFKSFFMRPRQLFYALRFIKPSQFSFVWRRMADFGVLPSVKGKQPDVK